MTTATKERPILFSGLMVKAILDGRKTQTRRTIKPQPISEDFAVGEYSPTRIDRNGEEYPGDKVFGLFSADGEFGIKCPYGAPGDRLWVRETFICVASEPGPTVCHYRADDDRDCFRGLWRPSIFMPRWASRITLEVTGVRAEKLQDISEQDAIAEGFFAAGATTSVERFLNLWVKINGEGSVDANPFVWVVDFKRVKP
jgi:hypothetical protein